MEPVDAEPDAASVPLASLFARLRTDSVAFFEAQVALVRVKGNEAARALGILVALFAFALALASGALIALLVGAMLVLAPHVGMAASVAIVALAGLGLAGLLGWTAARRIRRIIDTFGT